MFSMQASLYSIFTTRIIINIRVAGSWDPSHATALHDINISSEDPAKTDIQLQLRRRGDENEVWDFE